MDGALLRFYVHGRHHYHGMLMWEWLLMRASKLGVHGGSAFRAIAGFGRHHILHEQTFFDLTSSPAVEVEFIVTDSEAQALLELLHKAKLRVFFARIPQHFGVINPDTEDSPEFAEHFAG